VGSATGRVSVTDGELIQISHRADDALNALDSAASEGASGVRIYVQGFG
jgi:hypothetical protein